jgi:hypothetical protein
MKVTRFRLAGNPGCGSKSAFADGTITQLGHVLARSASRSRRARSTACTPIIGQSVPHSGSQVWLLLGAGAAGPMRDAWRFDATGCQGSSFITIDHLAPAAISKVCPTFSQTAPGVQIKDYSYDPLTGKCQAVMANGYASGVSTVNPATRYMLAGFKFDETFGVNGPADPAVACGGLEVGVCIHITRQSWIQLSDGSEHLWIVQ